VFLSTFSKVLPKCKVAHPIRQSCLYTNVNEMDVDTYKLDNYPLTSYYLEKVGAKSFYYSKNDLIEFYIYLVDSNYFKVIPLYNYAKNTYEIMLSDLPYKFINHYAVCIFKSPNRQIYLLDMGDNIKDNTIVIANVSKGRVLCGFYKEAYYLFHSMPIANSFVLVITSTLTRNGNVIVINIIDLIKEKWYAITYTFVEVIDAILNLANKSKHYKVIKSIGRIDRLLFEGSVEKSINTSIPNLVFYDKYVVNISLSVDIFKRVGRRTITAGQITLQDILGVVAVYQNKDLTVSLQINPNTKVKTSHGEHDVDFGSNTVLISSKYEVESEYDISQSHLYSVIASFGDYTIINEPNISREKFVLYYKSSPYFLFSAAYCIMRSFSDILFIRTSNRESDRQIVAISKDKLIKLNKLYKYYVEDKGKINAKHIKIINIRFVKSLLMDETHKNDSKNWIGTEITNKMEEIYLEDKLKYIVRRYDCREVPFKSFRYAYYIDYDSDDFYVLVFCQCPEEDKNYLYKSTNEKIYLFKAKIEWLLGQYNRFRLVWRFETNIPENIFYQLYIDKREKHRLIRLLGNKWNTASGAIDLKIFGIYDTEKAYYDYEYNRISVRNSTKSSSITSTLHLVHRITQILRSDQS
jgi:hypothetical protein